MSEQIDYEDIGPDLDTPAVKEKTRRSPGISRKKKDAGRPPLGAAFWFIDQCGGVDRARIIFEIAAEGIARLDLLTQSMISEEAN